MNIRKIDSFLLIFVIALLFHSCISDMFGVEGKGNVATESRTASDFQSIVLLTNADVTVSQDTAYRVEVEDYENLLDYIKISVSSKKLIVSLTSGSVILKNSVAKVHVWLPDSLTTLVAGGSGSIDVNASFKDLSSLMVTSSGNIRINSPLSVASLVAQSTGSGSISAVGTAKKLGCKVSGAGNLSFDSLTSKYAACYIYGSGNIGVRTDTLVAVIAGSGNVTYYGAPVLASDITGSGKLIQK